MFDLVIATLLQGGVDTNETTPIYCAVKQPVSLNVQMDQQYGPFGLNAQKEPGALGVFFEHGTSRIVSIDPNSDLFGQAQPGEFIISEDGVPNPYYMAHRMNFGEPGSVVTVTVCGPRGCCYRDIIIHRKPISSFQPWMSNWLLNK
jgi:hypothetical protein